jgi:hypothetical protein
MFGRCCLVLKKFKTTTTTSSFKVGDEVALYNPKFKTTTATTTIEKDGSKVNSVLFGLVSKVSSFKVVIVVIVVVFTFLHRSVLVPMYF